MTRGIRPRALLLDFYGTLVEEDDAVIARIVAEICAASPLAPAPAEVAARWNARFAASCAEAHGARFRRQRELEVESLRDVLGRFRCALDAEALSAELFAYWARPRPAPGAAEFLRELALPVCVVSNIDQRELELAIASLGW